MKKLTRVSLAVAGVIGALALVAGAVGGVYALRSLPQLEGQAQLPGLSASVSVRRDASDVTHILAQTSLDAYRTLGMVHAQERTWQLEFNRRVMHGELSEVLGAAALPTDLLLRTLGIRQAAQQQWAGLPPEAQAVLKAYAEGINAWVAQGSQTLTPEFLALGIDARAAAREGRFWTPQDSLGWALMMALDLGGNWGNELARLSALKELDTPRLWELLPPYEGEAPASTADLAQLYRSLGVFAPTGKVGSAALHTPGFPVHPSIAEKPYLASDSATLNDKSSSPMALAMAESVNAWAAGLGEVGGKGSNNWVVAGSRTQSGLPLLANDPHLGLSAPAIWYFARLKAPAAEGWGELNVTGATLPGLPFVVLGHNGRVAQGFTNTGPDVQDLYLEQLNPDNPNQYRVPAPTGQPPAWADMATRTEVIRVKGQPDVQHTVRSTRHGPVLSDAQPSHGQTIDTSRFVLALRWSALDADNQTVLAGLEGNRANNVGELLHAYRHYHSPMQNVVVADVQGHVAYKACGRVPVRGPDNDIRGVAPAPGWEARYDWQGWLPYSETPEVRFGKSDDNPFTGTGPSPARTAQLAASQLAQQRGWLATANQRIHGTDYPHFINQDWTPAYRQNRIEALLQATPQHSLSSMQVIQGDLRSEAALRVLPYLLNTESTHALAADAHRALASFDGVMKADTAAPLILTAWLDELTRRTLAPRLGEERFKSLYGKRDFRQAVEGILARNDAFWCGEGGCATVSAQALNAALDRLQTQYGTQVANWQWGQAHPAVSRHQPFSNVRPLARWFEVRVPTGGDGYTVNVGKYTLENPDQPYANRHAASLRAIYDLSNLENSRFIYQTGQSGNALSSRYRDMAGTWAAVDYRPLQLEPGHWVSEMTVKP